MRGLLEHTAGIHCLVRVHPGSWLDSHPLLTSLETPCFLEDLNARFVLPSNTCQPNLSAALQRLHHHHAILPDMSVMKRGMTLLEESEWSTYFAKNQGAAEAEEPGSPQYQDLHRACSFTKGRSFVRHATHHNSLHLCNVACGASSALSA